MGMYVVLARLTDEGAKNIKGMRQGLEANMARAEKLGVKIHNWFLVEGQYDIVVVAEAPDAETMAAQAAGVAGAGFTRTETMRAFTLDEVDAIMKKLPAA